MDFAFRKPGVAISVAVALLCLLLTVPAAAQATFPGRPGLIVFNLTFHSDIRADRPAPETGGLYAVRAGGHRPRQLTADPSDVQPSFAPSGERLVFQRLTGPTHAEAYYKTSLYMLDVSSGKLTRLTGGHGDTDPSFGRRGMIAFSRHRPAAKASDIVLRTAEGRLRPLTSGAADDFDPVFTPDGKRIVFLRATRREEPRVALLSVRLDGGGLRELGRHEFANQVDISPNGRRLAFNAFPDLPGGDYGAVWTRPLEGGPLRFFSRDSESAVYSPGGRRILYANDEGLWLRRAKGRGGRVQVLKADYDDFDGGRLARTPAWQPLP